MTFLDREEREKGRGEGGSGGGSSSRHHFFAGGAADAGNITFPPFPFLSGERKKENSPPPPPFCLSKVCRKI